MATILARPVVTMNLANRSISRVGLLVNRAIHPLVARRFGREVGNLTQICAVKIKPSQTGITVQTELGETAIDLPLYAKLLEKSGVSEMELPQGTAANQIGSIFRAVTTRTLSKAERLLADVPVAMDIVDANTGQKIEMPFTWKEFYERENPLRYIHDDDFVFTTIAILAGSILPAVLVFNNSRPGEGGTAVIVGALGGYSSWLLALATRGIREKGMNSLRYLHWQMGRLLKWNTTLKNRWLALHADAPNTVFIKLALIDNRYAFDAYTTLSKRGLSSDMLSQLAHSKNKRVLCAIARHPLATDKNIAKTIKTLTKRNPIKVIDQIEQKGKSQTIDYMYSDWPVYKYEETVISPEKSHCEIDTSFVRDILSSHDETKRAAILAELESIYPELVGKLRDDHSYPRLSSLGRS
ncbi:MAG: hypothetical protein WC527_00020 [Candidatus Margulisiibacteriota bacterium]